MNHRPLTRRRLLHAGSLSCLTAGLSQVMRLRAEENKDMHCNSGLHKKESCFGQVLPEPNTHISLKAFAAT